METQLKYIVVTLLFVVSSFSISSQNIKIAVSIDSEYKNPLYSMFFTSSNSFLATTYEEGEEFIRKFSFENGMIKDEGLAIGDSGVAISGQINGLPYLYLQHSGDVVPGYPDDSPFSFTSFSEEVFVASYLENQLVVVKQNGRLNLCEILGTEYGDDVRYERINISNSKKDENGIFIIGDSLYFSRIDDSGYYKLFKSVYDKDLEEWGEPSAMQDPYNIDGTNTLFYVWYEGIEYISSDRDGVLTIYAISYVKNLVDKFGIDLVNTELAKQGKEVVEENGRLIIKLKDGTRYEISVSPNGYAFYNTTVGLVDEVDKVDKVDKDTVLTVYLIDAEKNLNKDELFHLVDSFTIGVDKCYAALLGDKRITLVPKEFADDHGYQSTSIGVQNIGTDKNLFLVDNYVIIGHSSIPPGEDVVIRDDDDGLKDSTDLYNKSAENLLNKIELGREYSATELIQFIKNSGSVYDSCYIQLGLYGPSGPSLSFRELFPKYNIETSPRLGAYQYYIREVIEKAFNLLVKANDVFSKNKYLKNDQPFIRIGPWPKRGLKVREFQIVRLKNGNFIVY